MSHRVCLLALLGCIFTAFAPRAALAQPLCDAYVSLAAPGETPFIDSQTTAAGCTMSGSLGPVSVSSDGEADFGVLRARSEATFLAGETDEATSFARVEWLDVVTVDSPGLTGQTLHVHAHLGFSGFLDVTGSASGAVLLTLRTPSGTAQIQSVECFGGASCAGEPPPRIFDETLAVVWNVVAGEAGVLEVALATSVDRNPLSDDPGTADLDFGGTVTWGGIEAVTLNGVPVPYTIASESGTDWAVPVPEPGAAAMLAAGAAVLTARSRRTPRSRRPR